MTRRSILIPLAIAGLVGASAPPGPRADAPFDGRCEIDEVTCGSVAGPFAKAGACQFVNLGRVGEGDPIVGLKLEFFLGVRLEGKVAILGGGEFEKGVLVECRAGVSPDGSGPDLDKLRAGLTELLKKNPAFKEKYPGIEKIVIDPALRFRQAPAREARALRDGFKED